MTPSSVGMAPPSSPVWVTSEGVCRLPGREDKVLSSVLEHTNVGGGRHHQPGMDCQGAGTVPLGRIGESKATLTRCKDIVCPQEMGNATHRCNIASAFACSTGVSACVLTANSTGSCSKFLMFSGKRNSALRCLVGSTLCILAYGGWCIGGWLWCVCVRRCGVCVPAPFSVHHSTQWTGLLQW